ncbi:MarR family winged helix-turn-helix transcriptional regulator [Paractinoplanes lichenicola]|uniref:MarR family transcriptional regulator n=1 Tax=Paractinoplanes lichenicola TaxID=2802976 RepID=A0ABS1W1A7_9ACTN|nr:MarR family transcriptional regulator [Actinoplanes lichenicola]MBL7260519.1 MarR family transcriptional regulator [Actinoplanes lichenicola]
MEDFGDVLVWLAVVIQRRYAEICGEHDLTPAQAQLLCSIKDRPLRMAELAGSLGMAKNALSQLVDRIERRGLVQRDSPEIDRRVIVLAVTPEGKKIAEALYADVSRRLPDIADNLEPDLRQTLRTAAVQITNRYIPRLADGSTGMLTPATNAAEKR